MLVDRATLNQLYLKIMSGEEMQYPTDTPEPEGAVYQATELVWKVPRSYFNRYGMTILREAFERMHAGEMLCSGAPPAKGYVYLNVKSWLTLQEGPVLPDRITHDGQVIDIKTLPVEGRWA